MSAKQRIAIFGGTFDPPHTAHFDLLKGIQSRYQFDHIIVVPSHYPPGKSAFTPFQKRLDWTKSVFNSLKFCLVSDIEHKTNETIFGIDIFRILSLQFPQAEWTWILGEDQWQQINYWRNIEQYAFKLNWLVIPRSTSQSKMIWKSHRFKSSSAAYRTASTALMSISSSEIRALIASNQQEMALKWIPESIRNDVLKTYKQGGID